MNLTVANPECGNTDFNTENLKRIRVTSCSVDDIEYLRAKRSHRYRIDLFSPPNCDVMSDLMKNRTRTLQNILDWQLNRKMRKVYFLTHLYGMVSNAKNEKVKMKSLDAFGNNAR